MSDEGERTCPICTEEMDITDQHLKPCKCGYDICVWCWNHIIDMAEKDKTEGRCPACRTPYNKEKIVGTGSKCEGLVNEVSVEKKQKSQKGKTKTSKGRNQLGNVRVIQRNLVYVVGVPLNLADENLLKKNEYFGQYGKVLKVSISRTAAGDIQKFADCACSVYITYSKEEEAVRSIQSAHGFVLEGRLLRACFGTTKYCNAWLRNTPCTIAECLYLHEFAPQEDSFTKDDIITANSRVQQITGATNDMQLRFGDFLPPPADGYSNNTSLAKPISKSTTNNSTNSMKVSPPNSSSGRSVALPAAASWGTRTPTNQPNGPSKQHTDVSSTTPSFSSAAHKPSQENHTFHKNSNLGNPVSIKNFVGPDHKRTLLETPVTTKLSSSSTLSSHVSTTAQANKKASKRYSSSVLDKELNINDVKRTENSYFNGSSISMDKNQSLQILDAEQVAKPLVSKEAQITVEKLDIVSDLQTKVAEIAISEAEDLTFFNDQRLNDKQILTNTSLDSGESCLITDILYKDFNPWDESLTSPRNLAKFLGECNKQPPESHRDLSATRRTQNSNQSRFSFAREDECTYQESNHAPTAPGFRQGAENKNFCPDVVSNNSTYLENRHGDANHFSSFNFEDSDHFARNDLHSYKNKISVSRSQVSAPPGFSGPKRAPPPGFSSHERMEQTYENASGNHMFDMRKAHEVTAPVNITEGDDLELMDPAIMAVGGRIPSNRLDMRSNFPTHTNSFENDVRLQLLMQTSYTQQNPRFSQLQDRYPHQTDSYGHQTRMVENNLSSYHQTSFQQPRSSLNVNGHRYYSGQEDANYQLPTSSDLYNTTFGI